jgi:tetratricopeptide (TPR) repeat protein
LAALALLGLWSPAAILGRWQANLGAVAQARVELPRWPEQSSLAIRRQADLAPAERYYAQALADNPQDAVANERLGEIELARGDYLPAIQHLAAAHQADPGSYAARYSLGYAYVGAGRLAEAAAVLAGLDNIVGDLNSQSWQRGDEPAWVLNAYGTSLRLQPCQVSVYRDLPRWFPAAALSPETKRDYAEELSRLGGICRQQGAWEATTSALQARVSLESDNADYHRDLADAYRDAGQAGPAMAAYKQVLKLRPWDVYSQQELSKLGQ